jgi:phosphohistidine phosphatase
MRIVLLRHGTAAAHGTPGVADADRPLTDEGRRESASAGRALRAIGLRPACVVTSPFLRARQTAELASEVAGWELHEDDALASGFSLADLPALLGRHPGDPVVLVGHDPDLSDAVEGLTGARVRLAKGGAAAADLPDPATAAGGTLHWLLRPAQLRLVAGDG